MLEKTLEFLNKREGEKRIVDYELSKLLPGFMKVPYNNQLLVAEFLVRFSIIGGNNMTE